MIKQVLKNKVLVVVVLVVAFTVSYSSNTFAWGDHGGRGGHGGHEHYYYHGGRWDNGWFWGLFATGLVIGTIVATLPPRYETVYVSGAPYYYYDNVYYQPFPSGYLVVLEPATTTVVATPVVARPQVSSGETVVINIPNSSGGYTPVTLIRHKTGYIGPQGEYYEGHPTVEQLKALYGK